MRFRFLRIYYDARIKLIAFTLALTLPNIVMTFTEPHPWYTGVAQLLFGIGFIGYLMLLGKKPGTMFWRLFLFTFFAVFQLVLLSLYGSAPISVDMFLNVVSTNPNEAGELLGNIIAAVITVCTFYIILLIWATRRSTWTNIEDNHAWRQHIRRMYALPLFVFATVLCTILQLTTPFSMSADVYPINVSYNFGSAFYRYYQLTNYHNAAEDFRFDAHATHDATEHETYIIVIGETARSINMSLYGYERETTPRLQKRPELTVYRNVLSQSNTTHKSVPLLLTSAEAIDAEPMYCERSLIAAFREAGFHTIYISNQADNSGLTDEYSQEADRRLYVRQKDKQPDDSDLLAVLRNELQADNHIKRLIILHTYGSHFKYCDRVPAEYRVFTPCKDVQLKPKHREDLINAYDNTILYTDMVLDSIMTIADMGICNDTIPHSIVLAYTSDHGEDLYDDERRTFLHASPVVTFYQIAVPFIIWANDDYRTLHPRESSNIDKHATYPVSPAREMFHTMLGTAGISCNAYRSDHSLCDDKFTPGERLFLNDRNEACQLKDLHLTEHDYELMRQHGIDYNEKYKK